MRSSALFAGAKVPGVAAALLAALASGCGGGGGGGSDPEFAARALRVVSMDLDDQDGVPLNTPLTIEFSEFVAPSTIRPDTVQIRLGPRFGIQSFGEFKVDGNLVTFYPRLPTKADLSDSGFQPLSQYRVTVVGNPKVNHVAAYTGRPLVQTFVGSFQTAAATDPDVFTTETYKDYFDPPKPKVRFTNPPDVIPTSPWTTLGGAVNVPTDASITVVLYRIPLLPSTVTTSNITLTMIERFGTAVVPPRPIQGTPILDQSFDSVSIKFVPTFPLADQARYVLRIENRVTDLTGNYDLADNTARTDLRTLAETGGDPALSAFALAHPEEIDPRTFLIFTTRDEATKDASYFINFDGTDRDQLGGNGVDNTQTTASFNTAVAGAVAGVLTAAGGTGVLGDFAPVASTTLSSNSPNAVNGAFNYRQVTINTGVTVTMTGTLPASLLSLRNVTVAGVLTAAGGIGDQAEQNYQTSSMPTANGGTGNIGGGGGGKNYGGSSWSLSRGDSGTAAPNGGGGGGQGGQEPNSSGYGFGGGGGGGGHQYAGSSGANGNYSTTTWNGVGGTGGGSGGIQPTSALTNNGKDWYLKGVGGGGGGAGGNSHYYPTSTNWRQGAAGGGGGGGGILVKSAGNIRVSGQILSRGGAGGNVGSYYYYGAAGGGGGGGAIALYANDVLDVSGSTIDTSGGNGGSPYNYGWAGAGGKGGGGYVQLEAFNTTSTKIVGLTGASPANILPDYYTGTFNPTGSASDAPSVFTSTWFNMGVFDPVLQTFTAADFTDQNYADCTIKYELQMAREDPTNFGKADTSSINVSTGVSSDFGKASNWATINDPVLGIQDVTGAMNGHAYQFYRIRISFTLADGQTRSDPVPYVDRLRLRVKY